MVNRIFSITPGRSGMHYVKALCKHCTNLPDTATPEYFPEPVNYNEYFDSPDTVKVKIALARKVWDKMPQEFFSTSGMTKNGYLLTLFEQGARFVSLERDTIKNAYSWYLMDGAPGSKGRGIAYHPCIESQYNCILVKDLKDMTVFQRCVWLVLETKARARYLSEMGADVYFVNLEDLNFKIEVEKLFSWMKIEYDLTNVYKVLGTHINPMKDASRDLQENPHLPEDRMQVQIANLHHHLYLNEKENVRI